VIREEDIKKIGLIQRTHGLKGELNVFLEIDPQFLVDGHPLILDVEGIFVPFYAESVRPKGANTDLVKLEGVDSEEEARGFVNKTAFAVKSDLRDYLETDDDELLDSDELIGYDVVDTEAGHIGTVSGVDDTTANVLLSVTGNAGEKILIPLVDEFIVEIDEDDHRLVTDVPESLLHLNSNNISSTDDIDT